MDSGEAEDSGGDAPKTKRTGEHQLVGRIIGGRFEVVRPIGRGRYTLMVAARDIQGEFPPVPGGAVSPGAGASQGAAETKRAGGEEQPLVALKLLPTVLAQNESFVRRFRHEVRGAAAIDHPNVVRTWAWGDQGQIFVVSEFVPGGSLRALMNSGQQLTPEQAAMVAVDVARGLDHLHKRGIIHRTIRPSNILFRADGRAVISDVGLGWLVEEAQGDDKLDYRFMAPEMASDSADSAADGRLDIYALALSLAEAVDGYIPMLGTDIGSTLTIRQDNDVTFDSTWGALAKPFARAAHRDPERRSTADTLEIALMAVGDQYQAIGAVQPVGVFNAPGKEPSLEDVQPTFGAVGSTTKDGESSEDSATELHRSPLVAADDTDSKGDAAGASESTPSPRPAEDGEDYEKPARRFSWVTVGVGARVIAAIAARLRQVVFAPSGEVPNLVGKDLQVAKLSAQENGWKLNAETLIRKEGTEVDEVVEQSPDAGADLGPGKTLKVTVSLGPPLVAFPAVIGVSEADAAAALKAAGFVVGTVTKQFDEEVAKGLVILTDAKVDNAGLAPKGVRVNLVVSDGPAPRKIPGGLVGQPQAAVIGALESVQLQATVSAETSATVAEGVVIKVDPAEGTELAKGTTVKIVVSSGKPPVAIPFVGGTSLILAQDALQKAGFKVGEVTGPTTGIVAGTDPAAGAQVKPGTTIRIVMQ